MSSFLAEANKLNITIKGTAMYPRGVHVEVPSMLARLKDTKARFFALFSVAQDVQVVMQMAAELGMTGPGYVWAFTCAGFAGM